MTQVTNDVLFRGTYQHLRTVTPNVLVFVLTPLGIRSSVLMFHKRYRHTNQGNMFLWYRPDFSSQRPIAIAVQEAA
jgi:hypothetical protein